MKSLLKTSFWGMVISCLFFTCAGDPNAEPYPGDPNKCYFFVSHTSLNGHNYPIEINVYEGTSIGWPTVFHIEDDLIDVGATKIYALPNNKQYYFSYTHHPIGLQTSGCVESQIDIINPDGQLVIDTRYKSFCYDNNRWAIGGIRLHHGCATAITHAFGNYDEKFNKIND